MEKIKQKFFNIEFLRVFLTLAIVLFHNRISINELNVDLYSFLYNAFANGRNAVEGFFIISGFLFIITYKESLSLLDFIKKKYIRLSPVIAFSTVICAISWLMGVYKFKFIPNIMSIFLLNNFGRYWCRGTNVVLWYTSSLFFGLLVFFVIQKYVKEKYRLPVIIGITMGSFLLLQILRHGNYGGYEIVYYNFISVSTLMALAGLGTGIITAYLYKKYSIKDINLNTLLCTLLEIVSFSFIFWWLFFVHPFINHFYFVLGFWILFLCFILKRGIFSKIVDKKIWLDMGKYTYSIFVLHCVIIQILYVKLWKTHINFVNTNPLVPILINLLVVILIGIITYHLIEKPAVKFLTNYRSGHNE